MTDPQANPINAMSSGQLRNDFAWLLPVALLIGVVAPLHVLPISVGGDTQASWSLVRYLTDPSWPDWHLNHHTARWMMNFPAALAAGLTSPSVATMYFLNIVVFSLYFALALWVWTKLFGPAHALALGLISALNPLNIWLWSNFLPDSWSLLPATLSFALLAAGPPGKKQELMSALAMFAAYAVKITNLFFLPGVLLWLAWNRGSRAALRYGAVLVALFAMESSILSIVLNKPLPLGMVEATLQNHVLGMMTTYATYTWADAFSRWLPNGSAFIYTKGVIFLFIVFAMLAPFTARMRGRISPPVALCLAMGISFVLASTFSVLSIVPFRPVQPLIDRYLWPLFPFALTYVYWVTLQVAGRVAPATVAVLDRWQSTSAGFLKLIGVIAIPLALLASSTGYAAYKKSAHRNGISYPYNAYSANGYVRHVVEDTDQCRSVVFWGLYPIKTVNAFASRKGDPQWLSQVRLTKIDRIDFMRRYAPQLVGTTDESIAGKFAIIANGRSCATDLCQARVYGELDYRVAARCS